MNKKQKIIVAILSFIMLSAMILPNLKADLDAESIKSAQILADAGIIVDNAKNPTAYNISSSITRREMLKIMLKIAGVTPSETCVWKFADLPKSDWGCKYAETALKLWYLAPNKYFRPNDNVSKVEALKMIFKAKNISVSPTSDWREWYMQKSVELWYSSSFKDYDSASKRSFVFNVGAKTITKNGNVVKVSNVKEQVLSYEKPKLKITFASDMNRTSVLSNLKLYPEIAYEANWIDDKNLELVVADLVREETDILVNVLDSATTSDGKKLEKTLVKKFKLDGEALIDFTTPDGNINDLNQNITVRFSKPMVALTNLDNQAKCPIEITPSVPGKCVWITTSTFQFRPENGFPTGGKYMVNIPSGITTISWDTTINSKSFEIMTPDFVILSDIQSLWTDESMKFTFNDQVSLEKFKENFSMNWFSNDKFKFEYYKGKDELVASKNTISVFPITGDWGYNKKYTYTISNLLTSVRWNVGLKNTITKTIVTTDFLIWYNPFIFINETSDDKYVYSNFQFAQNNNIIIKKNPNILLHFYNEVSLDKNLFSSNLPFEIHYWRWFYMWNDYIFWSLDDEEINKKDNKRQVILSFSWEVTDSFYLKLNLSKYSSTGDKTLTFKTKNENTLVSYTQINYKKACFETTSPVISNLGAYFTFDKYGKVDYAYEVNEWTKDDSCEYVAGKHRYVLSTRLNPNSSYKLTIKKSLPDTDNYPLDKDYSLAFVTPVALNEDKQVSIMDARSLVLVPNDVKPLSVAIQSVNLTQAQAKVCVGDLDILSQNYLKNSDCVTKTIKVNNLGFKPNISVVDLEKVYGKEITKKYVTLEVSKIAGDKTEYEAKNDYYIQKVSFVISDIAATIKSAKNNLLWLHNYSSWANLTDSVASIKSYRKEAKYSVFGAYEWEKAVFEKDISFSAKADGIYSLGDSNFSTLLITLKTGEQVILDNVYSYYYQNENVYNYITTDKPIYKAGEQVSIAGISRILSAKWYALNTWNVQVYVRDAQYKEVLNKSLSLNALWAFDVSFDLKSDAKLGNYTIEVWGNMLSFAVEEYEKPDFKVTSKSQNDTYLFGNIAKIDVVWEYYIGLPLSNGAGDYTLSSSEFYFDGGKTTGYSFGEEQNFWWGIRPMSSKMGWMYYGGNQANTESSGKFVLDANGNAVVNIDLADSTKDKIYTVSTTVTDPNTKKSIATNATFKALRSKTFLGMKFDKYYYAFKDSANVGFVATDIDGNKLANQKMTYKVVKVDYTYDENTYKYDTKETLVSEKTITTNASWIASENFVFDKYGEYRFEITNGKYTTSKTVYVSGGDVLRPIEAQNAIELLSDKDAYKVGETSKIVINSPVIGVKALLTIEKLDEVLNYKVIDIDSYAKEVSIDIKKEYLPDFNVGVYIIKDVASAKESLEALKALRIQMLDIEQQLQKENDSNYIPYLVYDLSIFPRPANEDLDTNLLSKLADMRKQERELLNKILPEYFTGSKTLKVDSESIKLSSNVKLDKVSYLPGDKEKIELTITDNAGKPITWETTLSIIDQSLLALKDNKTDILNYFYSEKGTSVQTLGNMTNLIKRIEFKVEDNVENQARETAAWGDLFWSLFWDAATEEAAMAPAMDMDAGMSMKKEMSNSMSQDDGAQSPNATKLRTEFKDLAFYKTKVSVVNGKAIFEVPALPDNLTTWVVAWFAYTSDSKVGNYENTFKVQKELSLLPQIPRFFLAWDTAQISALVVNNTAAAKEVSVLLDMSGVKIIWENVKTISIAANSSKLASFDIEVGTGELDKNTSTTLNLKATSWTLVDALELTKPIYPSKTSEYVFTNGSTSDLSYEEKVDFGKVVQNGGYLEVSLWATILTNLTKNLDKVLYFPGDDLSSQITFLENSLALQELYKKLEKTSDFEAIILTDYNGKTYAVTSVMDLVRNNIKNYVQADNGMAYYKDCSSWWFADTCSNLDVTGKYLNLNIIVDGVDNKKVFEYYKKALVKKITENQKYSIFTTEIQDFLPIALYKDSDFVNTYFKPNTTLSNLEKLDYIKMYNLLWKVWPQSDAYLKDLKNAILVEARGSVLPAEKSFSSLDNSVASAKMIQVLIEKGVSEKLLTENLVRFLISNRDDAGNYYTYDFSEIVDAINAYVDFTGELKDVSFEAKAYLNSKDVMTSKFGASNKFDIDKKTFSFADYLQTGENSLGFEKTGNGKLYYDVWVRYYILVSEMTSREEWITVSRNYYSYDEYQNAFKKDCFSPWWYYDFGGYCTLKKVKNIDNITSAQKGDYIVGEIEILLDKERTDVVVNDFIPAWAEILNTNFNTTSDAVKNISGQQNQTWWYGGFDRVEQKDDRIELYAKHLNAGSYKYTYVLKANHIWNYNLKPATAELLEKPEIWGRSNGGKFEIK